jgi:hypothetical protein
VNVIVIHLLTALQDTASLRRSITGRTRQRDGDVGVFVAAGFCTAIEEDEKEDGNAAKGSA